MKVADASIEFAKDDMRAPPAPDVLNILDDLSVLDRFNLEKSWIEFVLSRAVPSFKRKKMIGIAGMIHGLHKESVYKRLEAAFDGIIDFKLEEAEGGKTRNVMRIRSMRNVAFEQGLHALRVGENFEVTLEK